LNSCVLACKFLAKNGALSAHFGAFVAHVGAVWAHIGAGLDGFRITNSLKYRIFDSKNKPFNVKIKKNGLSQRMRKAAVYWRGLLTNQSPN
jgi:hypothetical protein